MPPETKVAAVIPARLAATRLPNKPLIDIAGKPMIQHVYERASRASHAAFVVVATPDAEIYDAVRRFGGEAVMTSLTHRSGTDRVAEAARALPAEYRIIVNVQGDEPLLDPSTIDAVAAPLLEDAGIVMTSAMARLPEDRVPDPNAVKVVVDRSGFALYFSRSPLPFRRNDSPLYAPLLHIGLYAYRRDFLETITNLEPTPLEQIESLEQLRVLESGCRIRMVETARPPESVDTPEDLARVRELVAGAGA